MRRVVLDTNVWVSAVLKKRGHYAQLVQRMLPHVEIAVSEPILSEVRRTLLKDRIRQKYRLTEALIDQALNEIQAYTTPITDLPPVDAVLEDPDDNVILATAVAAQADFLVSYDPHLLRLKAHQGICIVSPQQFVPILEQVT